MSCSWSAERYRPPGAVLLAAEAALRAGAGKLALATVAANASALAVAVPESQVVGLASEGGNIAVSAADEVVERAQAADLVLVGPGFSDPDASVAFLGRVLPRLECPVVMDALASAYLTDRPDGLRHLEGRAILTVNPSELAVQPAANRTRSAGTRSPPPSTLPAAPKSSSCTAAPTSTSSRRPGKPGSSRAVARGSEYPDRATYRRGSSLDCLADAPKRRSPRSGVPMCTHESGSGWRLR